MHCFSQLILKVELYIGQSFGFFFKRLLPGDDRGAITMIEVEAVFGRSRDVQTLFLHYTHDRNWDVTSCYRTPYVFHFQIPATRLTHVNFLRGEAQSC